MVYDRTNIWIGEIIRSMCFPDPETAKKAISVLASFSIGKNSHYYHPFMLNSIICSDNVLYLLLFNLFFLQQKKLQRRSAEYK